MNPVTGIDLLQSVSWALLHFLWQGTLLGLAAWGGLWALRRRRPEVRYAFGCAVLVLMAATPPATLLWLLAHPAPVAVLVASPIAQAPRGYSWQAVEAALKPWLPWICWSYAAGVGALSLRLAGSWVWLQAFRWRGTRPASLDWQLTASAISRRLGINRAVRVLESSLAQVPMAIGVFRPVVLFPSAVLMGMDPTALEAILAHELAHIRRHDYLVNLLQTLLETLLFYHPAVWWLSRQVRSERELCCDDCAVALCGDPLLYSRALARLEEIRSTHKPAPQLAAAANGGSLMNRIQRLLLPALSPMLPSRGALLAGLTTTVIAAAGLGYAQDSSASKGKASESPKQAEGGDKRRDTTVVIAEKDKGKRVSIKMKGKVDLPSESSSLPALEEGASVRIEIREEGASKVLDLSRKDGKESRSYTVDGKEVPLDPQAEKLFQEQLKNIKQYQGKVAITSQDGENRKVKVWVSKPGEGKRGVYVYRSGDAFDLSDLEPSKSHLWFSDGAKDGHFPFWFEVHKSGDKHDKAVEVEIRKHLEEGKQARKVFEVEIKKRAEEARKESQEHRKELEKQHGEWRVEASKAREALKELKELRGLKDLKGLEDLHLELRDLDFKELDWPEGVPHTIKMIKRHRDLEPEKEMAELKAQMERLESRMKKLQERMAEAKKSAPRIEVETKKAPAKSK